MDDQSQRAARAGADGALDALRAAEASLLAPGAPFELEDALVLGEPMRVFKRRAPSLRALLAASARLGDAEYMAFCDGVSERRFTFREHARLVASTAAAMRERYGVGPGDRVAILAANCPEWVIAFWAAVSLGAIAVGLNAWWTGPEIRAALDDCAPTLLLADARRAARIEGDAGAPMVVFEEGARALFEYAPDAALSEHPIGEDDPAIMLYTSGTTGRPKGALHSHRNVVALLGAHFFNGARLAMVSPPPPPDRPACVFVTSPLFHVSGLHSAAVSCLAAGTRSVWLAGRFDAGLALRLMVRERVTAWGFTATLLHRVVHHPDVGAFDLSGVRTLGGGGSPITPELQARTREVFTAARDSLGVGYGLTECTALATLNPGPELAAHPESVGRPVPTVELDVRGDDGASLPEGAYGEVCVRSPMVMLGYWRNPAATRDSIGPGRWLRTGDIGRIAGGRLTLAARARDLILRGGENVYPAEIERRLEAHPDVLEAAVYGVAHAELGEEVKAVVVPRSGASLDAEALRGWVGAALAAFKVPVRWELRAAPLPRNATGKVLKHVLRDAGEATFVAE